MMDSNAAKSRSEQAAALMAQGLLADRDELVLRLETVGFYRLNGYAYPFRQVDSGGNVLPAFKPGTDLKRLWFLYRFDRNLRFLFLDAIERIEIALRSQLAYLHTRAAGPFAYARASYFPAWKGYLELWDRVKKGSKEANRNEALRHFFTRDTEHHQYPPLGIAIGFMELGALVYFFDYSDKETVRKPIVNAWGIDARLLTSWMHALNHLRNDCAHHARIWNKRTSRIPRIPKCTKDPRWYYTYDEQQQQWKLPSDQTSAVPVAEPGSTACFLFICRTLLRSLAPTSAWNKRISKLIAEAEASGVDVRQMGLPKHWETHPLWE